MDSHLHLKILSLENGSNYSIAPFTFFSLCNFKCFRPLSDFKLIFSLKFPIFPLKVIQLYMLYWVVFH